MTLEVNEMLYNRYRIIGQLGEGGMGAVYRVWDTHIDSELAIKEMFPQPDIDEALLNQLRQQFQQEAKILARLRHPNLVRVTDFFQENENAYLVMDLVEGTNLAKKIQEEDPLPESDVREWAGQLLSALAYCHDNSIIHRDIKPQNIIIRPDGQAVLVDFGLVKLWDPDDPRTKTAMHGMGTPEYAPPEQYDIGIGNTTPRSDIYSLGATLYHALTGQAPPTASYRMAYPEKHEENWAKLQHISPEIKSIIAKAMEIASSKRWPSVQAMAQALGVDTTNWPPPTEQVRTFPLPSPTKKISGEDTTTKRKPFFPVSWQVGAVVGVIALIIIPLLIWRPGPFAPNPTPTPTPTATSTSQPTPTKTSTLTPTPKVTPTSVEPTPTQTPDATETPRSTAAPSFTRPVLTFPQQGETYKNPITLQWTGNLNAGQSYLVQIWHESGHSLPDRTLQTRSTVVDLPADRVGAWSWTVSVVDGSRVLATSAEGMFWFNPLPGVSPGTSPLSQPDSP